MNYALIAAELRAEFERGRYSVPEYQARIAALNRRYSRQAKKAGRTLDNRKRPA